MARLVLVLFALLALGAAGFLLLRGPEDGPLNPGDSGGSSAAPEQPGSAAAAATVDGPNVLNAAASANQRTELENAAGNVKPDGDDPGWIVRGRLVNDNAEPVANVDLHLLSGSGAFEMPGFSSTLHPASPVVSEATTNSGGEFQFAVARSDDGGDRGRLLSRSKEWLLADANPEVPFKAAVDGTVHLGDLVAQRTASIRGLVVDTSGTPISNIPVRLSKSRDGGGSMFVYSSRDDVEANTDNGGWFEFNGIRAGRWIAKVHSPTHLAKEELVTLEPAQRATDVRLIAEVGKPATGVVVNDLGAPVSGARVGFQMAMSSLDRRRAVATTGSDGAFRLANESAVKGTLVAHAQGHSRSEALGVQLPVKDVRLVLERHGSLTGVVFGESGQGLAGVSVFCGRSGNGDESLVTDSFERVSEVTDAEGRFEVKDLAAGDYRCVFTHEQYATKTLEPVSVFAGEATPLNPVELTEGVRLTVTVKDADGKPAAGATVNASSVLAPDLSGHGAVRVVMDASGNPMDSPNASRRSAKTDREGRATIVGLDSGDYRLTASREDSVDSEAAEVTVGVAGETTASLQLRLGGTAEVRVVDEAGDPVSGAELILYANNDSGGDMVDGVMMVGTKPPAAAGTTNAQGIKAFAKLAAGSYEAMLKREPSGQPLGFSMGSSGIKETAVEFNVAAGEQTVVTVVQPDTRAVYGVVSDASGPVSGANVELKAEKKSDSGPDTFSMDLGEMFGAVKSDKTDADGRYRIEGVMAGSYTLSFGRAGQAVMMKEEVVVAGADIDRDLQILGGTVTLTAVDQLTGQPVANARAVLHAEREAGTERREQRGIMISMRGSDGDDPGGESMSFGFGNMPTPTVTDAEGNAVIRDVPEGKYRVTLTHPDYSRASSELVVVARGQETVVGKVDMPAGARVTVHVVDANGEPAGMCLVSYERDGNQNSEMSSESPKHFKGLTPGTYKFSASRLNMGALSPPPDAEGVEVTLEKGANPDITLRLK